jgi:hypothetical protein
MLTVVVPYRIESFIVLTLQSLEEASGVTLKLNIVHDSLSVSMLSSEYNSRARW